MEDTNVNVVDPDARRFFSELVNLEAVYSRGPDIELPIGAQPAKARCNCETCEKQRRKRQRYAREKRERVLDAKKNVAFLERLLETAKRDLATIRGQRFSS